MRKITNQHKGHVYIQAVEREGVSIDDLLKILRHKGGNQAREEQRAVYGRDS